MKEIQLTKGKVAIVDHQDFETISKYKWHANKRGDLWYASAYINKKITKMHRLIMDCKLFDKQIVDHIDGNGLNNQRINLRICTHSDNMKNRCSSKNGTSKYLGVCFYLKTSGKGNIAKYPTYRAELQKNGKRMFVKDFKDEIEAAKAYNEAAIKYHGEFARLNKI